MNIKDISYLKAKLNPKSLELILFPTEQCNFRCVYCYEDFSIGAMEERYIKGVKALIAKRLGELNNLTLSWFGGEPLAAKNIIYDISQYAKDLCDEIEVTLDGAITTNGYLLDVECMEKLVILNQKRFQISLDGLEDMHDKTRRLMSGAGTFKRIWSNLEAIAKTNLDFHITLRLHLTLDNLESMRKLAMTIKLKFLSDHRFSVFLKPIENLGGKNSNLIATLDKEKRAAYLADISNIIDIGKTSTVPSMCYAGRPNSLIIRASGKVQKCTVLLDDDRNTVGHLMENGEVNIVSEKMHIWMAGLVSGDKATIACPATSLYKSANRIIPIKNL